MHTSDHRDGGFTLIEAAVALLIATFIFVALGQTIATALQASESRRLEQQADALIAEVVEGVRNLSYADLALDSADPTLIGGTTFDPGSGAEAVIVEAGGGLSPQVTTESFNTITFTLTRYATWVDDNPSDASAEDYKRLTVIARWDSRGQTRTEQRDTLVSFAEEGTPSTTYGASIDPAFDDQNAAAGQTITYSHTITNIGSSPDTLELTVSNDLGWTVVLEHLGVVPGSTNGIPTADTGELGSGATYDIDVLVTVPAGTPAGAISTTTLEVSPAGDPSVSASANDTTTSTGLTAAPIDLELFLKSGWALNQTVPSGGHTTTAGENGTGKTWSFVASQDWEATTNATLRLFVGRRGTCAAGNVEYTATLRTTSGTWGSQASGPVSVSGCDPTALSTLTIGTLGDTISAGQTLYLDILITKPSTGGKSTRGLTIGFDGADADSSIAFQVVSP